MTNPEKFRLNNNLFSKYRVTNKNLRIVSQGIFLLLFLFLFIQTESKGDDTLGYPVKLFLDFDPLIFITTLLASRATEIPSAFFLSLIVVLLTIVLGRVFCGWICPLGTLNNIVSSLKKRHSSKPKKAQIPPNPSLEKGGRGDFIEIGRAHV